MQLHTISERLEKLESEREELLEYQSLDRRRRAIEYCILHNDRAAKVEQINDVRASPLQPPPHSMNVMLYKLRSGSVESHHKYIS